MALTYPEGSAERDRWILARRPQRAAVNAHQPYAFFVEEESGADGRIESVATIFLSNRECAFRCTMCDLWRNTLTESVPIGAIPEQIDFALTRLRAGNSIKLYNSGSFFDPRAIPPEDYKAIANAVAGFKRVIVECHPAFVGERCTAFSEMLNGRLEVAMGLETAHPQVLERLNKRMTLDQFSAAAAFLHDMQIDLRVFILVQPPFMEVKQSLYWAQKSLDFAFDCDAAAATLIPTRSGNGAMEALAESGMFVAPGLKLLEDAAAFGLGLGRGRVFADLWDVKQGLECANCFDVRVHRLQEMNLKQTLNATAPCPICGWQGQSVEED